MRGDTCSLCENPACRAHLYAGPLGTLNWALAIGCVANGTVMNRNEAKHCLPAVLKVTRQAERGQETIFFLSFFRLTLLPSEQKRQRREGGREGGREEEQRNKKVRLG
jgi:hypothetical protein